MKLLVGLLACVFATTVVVADEVCYGDLGCYSNDWPFTSVKRPVPHLPWSPEELQTKFWLYTRMNKHEYQLVGYEDEQSIINSNFRAMRKTKILVHGFTSSGNATWVQYLKKVLLDVENVNVIVVDWSKGANPTFIYGQACANTRIVGAQIAKLINTLQASVGAFAADIHVMGHSLGAHVAGYAGERLLNLGRITALDAAEPYYQGTPINVRLDPTDARYVDAIHTDGKPYWEGGWGMMEPVGHADFYPNGGENQPGCPGNEFDEGEWWRVSCSHGRSHDLMIDSIVNADKPMYGYLCTNYDTYMTGACDTCAADGCPTLGYYSNNVATSDVPNVKYYLTTGSVAPYAEI